MIISVFGMWCFIRGQQNALQLTSKEIPVQIRNPVQVITEAVEGIVEEKKEKEQAENIEAHFNWQPPTYDNEKGD